MFKKKKKYKITLTEDEIFILGPIILMWVEDLHKELKENPNSTYKEIYKRDMDLGHSMIAKIKEADGSNKYWRKFWKKYKKEKK